MVLLAKWLKGFSSTIGWSERWNKFQTTFTHICIDGAIRRTVQKTLRWYFLQTERPTEAFQLHTDLRLKVPNPQLVGLYSCYDGFLVSVHKTFHVLVIYVSRCWKHMARIPGEFSLETSLLTRSSECGDCQSLACSWIQCTLMTVNKWHPDKKIVQALVCMAWIMFCSISSVVYHGEYWLISPVECIQPRIEIQGIDGKLVITAEERLSKEARQRPMRTVTRIIFSIHSSLCEIAPRWLQIALRACRLLC